MSSTTLSSRAASGATWRSTHPARPESIGLVQLRAGSSLIDLVSVDSPLGAMGGAARPDEGT